MRTKAKESSKETKDSSFLNKIKKIGKNISQDFADMPLKLNNVKPATKNPVFSNNDNWFLFQSKAINIQCIEEMNNIFHTLELDPNEASDILVNLFKKYQIKNNDIIPLLESQQRRLVQAKSELNCINRKKKILKKIENSQKKFF